MMKFIQGRVAVTAIVVGKEGCETTAATKLVTVDEELDQRKSIVVVVDQAAGSAWNAVVPVNVVNAVNVANAVVPANVMTVEGQAVLAVGHLASMNNGCCRMRWGSTRTKMASLAKAS
jgi:hypothetical protein